MHTSRTAHRAAASAIVAVVLCDGTRVDATPSTSPSCTTEVRDDLFSTFLPATGASSPGFDVTPIAGGEYLIIAGAPGILANDQPCGPVDISRTLAIGCDSGPAPVSGSSDGSFSMTLPAGCSAASVSFDYDLVGEGGTIGVATATTVIDPVTYFRLPDETSGSRDDAANLPATGRDGSALIAVGAFCLLAGLAMTAGTRIAPRRSRAG